MFYKIDKSFDASTIEQGFIEQRIDNIVYCRMHIIRTSSGELTIRAERLFDKRKVVVEACVLEKHPFHFEGAVYWFIDTMQEVAGKSQYILWSPESIEAPTKPFYSKTIASCVATEMSLRLNQKFYVCKLESSVNIKRE